MTSGAGVCAGRSGMSTTIPKTGIGSGESGVGKIPYSPPTPYSRFPSPCCLSALRRSRQRLFQVFNLLFDAGPLSILLVEQQLLEILVADDPRGQLHVFRDQLL